MMIDLAELKALDEIHRKLAAGYHLSENEPGLWLELSAQHSAYETLFAALGYDLRHDERGFFYFDSPDTSATMSKTSQWFALTLYCLVEDRADAGKDPLQSLFDESIGFAEMDALVSRHLALFEQLNVHSASDLRKEVFNRMLRLGFAREDGDGFRLLPPCHRFIDAALALTEEAQP
ncbi:condensin complex protein MksE [Gallaecimonas sp. GXIMD1310]|uniref:condensin complex protein MksE n=1 Tax=Gallaecimonas sp. GXIMD1310 TaxID=3131926 RepID=UPI00324AFFD8